MTDKIIATTRENLKEIIQLEIKMNGNSCDLNHIDVSRITDMRSMFANSKVNGNISNWNTSNVSHMGCMFYQAQFNCDISNWNVSNVKNMNYMFYDSQFNGDISKWNVSNVTNISGMFSNSKFNGDLTKWLPYSLLKDKYPFKDCKASKPYWANFDNVITRNEAINNYLLYSELNNKLHIKEHFTKKNKI